MPNKFHRQELKQNTLYAEGEKKYLIPNEIDQNRMDKKSGSVEYIYM